MQKNEWLQDLRVAGSFYRWFLKVIFRIVINPGDIFQVELQGHRTQRQKELAFWR